MRCYSIVILILCGFQAFSQGKILKRELQVENDNDAYTFNISRDQYYSQGVALRYRILEDSGRLKNDFEKVIRAFCC